MPGEKAEAFAGRGVDARKTVAAILKGGSTPLNADFRAGGRQLSRTFNLHESGSDRDDDARNDEEIFAAEARVDGSLHNKDGTEPSGDKDTGIEPDLDDILAEEDDDDSAAEDNAEEVREFNEDDSIDEAERAALLAEIEASDSQGGDASSVEDGYGS